MYPLAENNLKARSAIASWEGLIAAWPWLFFAIPAGARE